MARIVHGSRRHRPGAAALHVPAQQPHVEVGPQAAELRLAARRAHDGVAGQVRQGRAVARDEGVAHVLARQEPRQRDAVRQAVGRSSAEWTATSMSPASRAMSSSLVKRPLPPASNRDRSWMASPVVAMTTRRGGPRPIRGRRRAAPGPRGPGPAPRGCPVCQPEHDRLARHAVPLPHRPRRTRFRHGAPRRPRPSAFPRAVALI